MCRTEVLAGFRDVGHEVSRINAELSQLKVVTTKRPSKKSGRPKLAHIETDTGDADDEGGDDDDAMEADEGSGPTRSLADKPHHNRLMVRG